jgi:hypothetical protein
MSYILWALGIFAVIILLGMVLTWTDSVLADEEPM